MVDGFATFNLNTEITFKRKGTTFTSTVYDDGDNLMTGSLAGSNTTDNTTTYRTLEGTSDNTSQNLIATDTNEIKIWYINDLSSAGTVVDKTKTLGFWLYIKDATTLAKFKTGNAVQFRIGINSTLYYYKYFSKTILNIGWNWLNTGSTYVSSLSHTGSLGTETPKTFTANDSTETITCTGHGLDNGRTIRLSSTGTLPGGLNSSTLYYIINKTDDTYQLSLTEGGGAINITSTGTGTHTATVDNILKYFAIMIETSTDTDEFVAGDVIYDLLMPNQVENTFSGEITNYKEAKTERKINYTKVVGGMIIPRYETPSSKEVDFDFTTRDLRFESFIDYSMIGETSTEFETFPQILEDFDYFDEYKIKIVFNNGTHYYAKLFYNAVLTTYDVNNEDGILIGKIGFSMPMKDKNGYINYITISTDSESDLTSLISFYDDERGYIS